MYRVKETHAGWVLQKGEGITTGGPYILELSFPDMHFKKNAT